jgi:nucleoside-diphosphate-sugar epimerase
MRRVLITGASGFIGTNLLRSLALEDCQVWALARRPLKVPSTVELVVTDKSLPEMDWARVLEGIDVIVHLAAAAHSPDSPDNDLDWVNHLGTARFARQAAAARVGHFVFISSISAQVGSTAGHVLTEESPPHPVTAYGRSKLAAEGALRAAGVHRPAALPRVWTLRTGQHEATDHSCE